MKSSTLMLIALATLLPTWSTCAQGESDPPSIKDTVAFLVKKLNERSTITLVTHNSEDALSRTNIDYQVSEVEQGLLIHETETTNDYHDIKGDGRQVLVERRTVHTRWLMAFPSRSFMMQSIESEYWHHLDAKSSFKTEMLDWSSKKWEKWDKEYSHDYFKPQQAGARHIYSKVGAFRVGPIWFEEHDQELGTRISKAFCNLLIHMGIKPEPF